MKFKHFQGFQSPLDTLNLVPAPPPSPGAQTNTTHHGRHSEISGVHFLGQPVDLPAGVAKDHSLGDGESLVQIT